MTKRKKHRQVGSRGARRQPAKGRRFTPEQHAEALRLIASGLKR